MRALDVFLLGEHVGRIAETRRGARFEYDAELAERAQGLPLLSLCLPVKRCAFGESKTGNWFEGLLPEGPRRDDVCRRLGIDAHDWVGLIGEIGWECAGAVQVFDQVGVKNHEAAYKRISAAELAARLSDISSRQPQTGSREFRMSLGGFQDKMCVAMPRLENGVSASLENDVLLPEGGAASTHILKPESTRYPGSAESEVWAMMAASRAAQASHIALLELDGSPPTLAVERYDRVGADWPHDVGRVHQEDACQALGLPPSRKYASEPQAKGDDPTYLGIARLLIRYAQEPVRELKELLRHMTAAFVLGDWDAHAKNISFLYEKPGVPSLAPLYDVVPIAEVEPRTGTLSMRISGTLDPDAVTRESIMTEVESWGLEATSAETVLDTALAALEEGLAVASERYPKAGARHEKGARSRIEKLKRQGVS